MANTGDDTELVAIGQIIAALTPLNVEVRERVISYVLQRFNISNNLIPPPQQPPHKNTAHNVISPPAGPTQHAKDIRTFKEEKRPSSANEMAAVVAYYLKELAPEAEQKDEILADDIEKYFKQARFPLPKAIGQTLLNAKNAGYFDPGSQRGNFKLNPVGHNLVAHGLPVDTANNTSGITRSRRKTVPTIKKKRASLKKKPNKNKKTNRSR